MFPSTLDQRRDQPVPSEGLSLTSAQRLRKLRAMSIGEFASRVGYRLRTYIERDRHRHGHFAREERLRHALGPALRSGLWRERLLQRRREPPARFFAGSGARPRMQELFRTVYQAELREARGHAENVRSRRIGFFGQTFTFGPSMDWHADPVSGRQWPRVYHADVPVHEGDVGFGDVKYVWELNRHQFLVDLARVHFLDESGRDAAEARVLVLDWLDQCPYGTGVPWACALEPAFRAVSWLWTYHLCLDDPALDADAHARWLAGFYDHGRFLHDHLELYSSPYNHLIGEAAALYMLGVLFPEFTESARWRARGRSVLESRLGHQFYLDGGSVEQSTFYHHATLGYYLLAVLLGRANGEEFAPSVLAAIEKGIEFSMSLMQPDGRIPRIGGADDGKPLRMEHLPLWDFRPYQAIGAVMFDRADFKYAAGRFHEDALWVLGPEGLERFTALDANAPVPVATAFTGSGYFVFRSGWTSDSDYVCFDCGEQARGLRRDSVPSAAHGHADCLSVTVWLGGRPFLVDPGFYCYNGDPEWEVHFRKTIAHNTVRIDGRDQAQHVAKMAWSRTFSPTLEGWHSGDAGSFATGSHDGYSRTPGGGVRHRRTVWLRPGGYVVIADELEGHGTHLAEWTWQFAPGEAVLKDAGGVAFEQWAEVAWTASHTMAADLAEGGPRPDEGWIAPSLGIRVPAPRLRLRGEFGTGRLVLLTVLAPRSAAGQEWRIQPCPDRTSGCVTLVLEGQDMRDVVIARTAATAAVADLFETDALVAIHRHQRGRNPRVDRAGGSYVRTISGAASPERDR